MGLRSIRKTSTPIGITSRGLAVFAISGAQPPEGDDGGTDGGKDGKEGDSGVSGDEGTGKPDDDAGGTGDTISKEEYESLKARMVAADKRADEAAKKVKEYEDKDKSDLEKATTRVADLEKDLTNKDKEIADLRFANAFALNPKYTWHDPEVVLGMLRKRDDVTFEDDGTVKGLEKALDAIAKAKPFLVKAEEEDGGSGGDGDGEGSPSGTGTGSGKRGDKKQADPEALAKKYPALVS